MNKVKIIVGLALFALLMSTGWQIAACELANRELKDDLKDVASLNASRIGLAAQQTDKDLRLTVIRKAASHDIDLQPGQILVKRAGTEQYPVLFLAAKYKARVWFPGFRLVIPLTATSED